MYRFYMKTNRKKTGISQEVIRTDGGWWFSEETSEGRLVYEVIERKEISPGHVLELLKPLPQDFLQLPCWQEAPQIWQVHQKVAQGVLMLLGDLQILEWWPESVGPLPELPLEYCESVSESVSESALEQPGPVLEPSSEHPELYQQPSLPHWIHQEVGHLHSIIQKNMKNMDSLRIKYQEANMSFLLVEKQQEKDVEKRYPSQHRKALKAHSIQHAQRPSEQSQKQVLSSQQGKELMMGQLCSPVFVPEQQSSRVLHYHPSKSQKQSSQANYNRCLIVQT